MIQKHNFILFTDGSCKENPGTIGAVAFSCTLNGGEKKLDCKKIESSKTKYNLYIKNIPKITNNVAEYEALTFGLEYVIKTISEKKLKNNDCFIEFNTDSNLVVKQIEGK